MTFVLGLLLGFPLGVAAGAAILLARAAHAIARAAWRQAKELRW
jgi:hypothetical protein